MKCNKNYIWLRMEAFLLRHSTIVKISKLMPGVDAAKLLSESGHLSALGTVSLATGAGSRASLGLCKA